MVGTGLEQFLDDFPPKKIPSETWIHPPTSIVGPKLGFLEKQLLAKPLTTQC